MPISFQGGPLHIHLYSIGLVLTLAFGLWYLKRRIDRHGYPTEWLDAGVIWIAAARTAGARLVDVVPHAGYFLSNPAQTLFVWQGGLSSFGGLAPVAWRPVSSWPGGTPP